MVFMIVRYIEKKQVGSLDDLFKPFCVFQFLLEWSKGLESHGEGVRLKFIRFIPQLKNRVRSSQYTSHTTSSRKSPAEVATCTPIPGGYGLLPIISWPGYPPGRNSECKARDLKASKGLKTDLRLCAVTWNVNLSTHAGFAKLTIFCILHDLLRLFHYLNIKGPCIFYKSGQGMR